MNNSMSDFDDSSINVNTLKTFIAVLEEGSVTGAAGRLGVSQSAVSHTLDKLRSTFDDSLFVRDGRGITPTAKAHELREPIEDILNRLQGLRQDHDFDPLRDKMEFTIATNDFPLGLIFPRLTKELHKDGIDVRFNFIPAGIPSANLNRTSNCQLLITPAPPNRPDIRHLKLIESKMVCFFDPAVRKAPGTLKEYLACRYVDVRFSTTESSQQVLPASLTAKLGEPTVAVPNFNAVTPFIQGTDLITTQLSVMEHGSLKGLAWSPLPVRTKSRPLFLLWHERYDNYPAHRWMRQRIKDTVKSVTST